MQRRSDSGETPSPKATALYDRLLARYSLTASWRNSGGSVWPCVTSTAFRALARPSSGCQRDRVNSSVCVFRLSLSPTRCRENSEPVQASIVVIVERLSAGLSSVLIRIAISRARSVTAAKSPPEPSCFSYYSCPYPTGTSGCWFLITLFAIAMFSRASSLSPTTLIR